MAGGLQRRHGRRVEGHAEDVLLALEHDAVQRDVVGAARGFEETRAHRGLVVLLRREDRRNRSAEKLAHVERAASPLLPVVGGELVAARGQHRLHLVRRQLRIALQQIGNSAGGERGRLGGAATAEIAVTQSTGRVGLVDVRAGDAEALQVRARRDQVCGAAAGAAAPRGRRE